MELFGIVFAIPAAFIASALYAPAVWFVARYRWVAVLLLAPSIGVIGGLFAEWLALVFLGAVKVRATVGLAFPPIHLALFFLAVPALANVLVISAAHVPAVKKTGGLLIAWLIVAILCSAFALPVVLTQYYVSEALYGIDGVGGPYGPY